MIADVLSPDGEAIVNQIVLADDGNPATFGAVARVAEGSAIGWVKTGSVWGPPTPPAPTRAQLVAFANTEQWRLATGGYTVTIDGKQLLFLTDDTSRGLLDGKVARLAQPSPPASVRWQAPAGDFVSITPASFIAAATAVADFVQATFDALEPVLAAIEAGTITTTAEIDGAAWPVNVA